MNYFNINKNDKIVLLCVRDPVYRIKLRNNYVQKNDIIYSNRDSKISDFEKLVQYLCEKNYKVIRMGSLAHEKIKNDHPNLIDYAFSKINLIF